MRSKHTAILLTAIAIFSWLAGRTYVSVKGDLTRQRQAIEEQWLRVEAALHKRADAIPHLKDAVRGGVPDAVWQELGAARAALAGAHGPDEKIRANRELSAAIAKLLLRCETDARLRQSGGFQQLRDELAAREDEIANERFQYNSALERYNARMRRFPDNVVASLAGFSRIDAYFSTGPESAKTPLPLPYRRGSVTEPRP